MRAVILIGLLTLGAVVAVASPRSPSNCTKTGTNERNVLAGTPNHDVLCALGGRDYVAGLAGSDVLFGGGGRDTMVGGGGTDKLYGGGSRDHLFAVDGHYDVVVGGSGRDVCFADAGDKVQGCEAIFRGASLKTAKALSGAFGGQAVAAEELIGEPVPTVTVTETITIGATTVTVPPNCGGHPAPPPIC